MRNPPPTTPKKGLMVPPSPVKVSSSVRNSLAALSRDSKTKMFPSVTVPKSLKGWLLEKPCSSARNTLFSPVKSPPFMSPQKCTPHKLTIKSPLPGKSPAGSVANRSLVFDGKKPSSSCKRKLYDDGSPDASHSRPPSSKRARVASSETIDENARSARRSPMAPNAKQVLRQTENVASHSGPLKEACDMKTPQKTESGSSQESYQSPTVNLPNYVLDPQPRTPVGNTPTGSKTPRTPDWLTKIRLERKGSVDSSPGGSEHNPDITPGKDVKRTPRGSALRPKRSNSSQKATPENKVSIPQNTEQL